MSKDDKEIKGKLKKDKSELAIRELEEAYKTYTNEDYEKVYGYADEDFSSYGTETSSWPSGWPESSVFDLPGPDWYDSDEIIYSHGELEVGALVKHEDDVGVVMKKVDIGVTDATIEDLRKSGIAVNAISMDNILGSWDFKQGYDNNFYSVALAGKPKKIFTIGWKLKEITKTPKG